MGGVGCSIKLQRHVRPLAFRFNLLDGKCQSGSIQVGFFYHFGKSQGFQFFCAYRLLCFAA